MLEDRKRPCRLRKRSAVKTGVDVTKDRDEYPRQFQEKNRFSEEKKMKTESKHSSDEQQ